MSSDDREPRATGPLRHILFAAGCVCVGLGVVGIVVPVLPTTPFLLLAAACFLRSSPRLHKWLLNSPLLGGYIRHYRDGTGIPPRSKLTAIGLLWLATGWSTGFVIETLWLRVLLVLIAIAVTIHLATIRPRRG